MRDGIEPSHKFYNEKGKLEWRCKFCLTSYQISGGTLLPKKHLEGRHGVYEQSPKDIKAQNIHISIKEAMTAALMTTHKRRRLNNNEPSDIPLDPDVLEILYVKFITVCNQSLRLVECPEFRAFLSYLNPDMDKYLITSHVTAGKWVNRQYDIEKESKKQHLQNARSKIHISTDLWTSPGEKAIMAIVAHSFSEDNILECFVLDICEVLGTHKGRNLAPYILDTLEDWGITNKLGWFVMDNASNNDTMMEKLSIGIYPFYFF